MKSENVIALYELLERCNDPSHVFFPGAEENLIQAGILSSQGYLGEEMREVVLCAVRQRGMLDYVYTDPCAEIEEKNV